MENTATAALMQMASVFQMELFPRLEEAVGQLNPQARLLTNAIATLAWDRYLPRHRRGRPAPHRKSLLTAFLAKAIYNFPTTRDLLDRLRQDGQLRILCGWHTSTQVPSESTFSRAFALFAKQRIPEHLHEALIRLTVRDKLFGHIARDSTAITARERVAAKKKQKIAENKICKAGKKTKGKPSSPAELPPSRRRPKMARRKKKPGKHPRSKASDRGTVVQRRRSVPGTSGSGAARK